MHRQDAQHAVGDVHIEHRRQHRDHVDEILMRQHHRLWLPRRARGEYERRDGVRSDLSRKQRISLCLLGLRSHLKDLVKGPHFRAPLLTKEGCRRFGDGVVLCRAATLLLSESLCKCLSQFRILSIKLRRQHYRRYLGRLGKVHDLLDRRRRIDRNGGRTGFENAEIRHSPFGHIVRIKNDAVA